MTHHPRRFPPLRRRSPNRPNSPQTLRLRQQRLHYLIKLHTLYQWIRMTKRTDTHQRPLPQLRLLRQSARQLRGLPHLPHKPNRYISRRVSKHVPEQSRHIHIIYLPRPVCQQLPPIFFAERHQRILPISHSLGRCVSPQLLRVLPCRPRRFPRRRTLDHRLCTPRYKSVHAAQLHNRTPE